MRDDPETLVSTEWLAAHLGDPDLKLVDASWYLPDADRDARAEYEAGHIPGAVFLDIDAVSDTASDLPHMAPSPETFAEHIGAMGIGDGDRVVIYDGAGLFSAARGWWLFRLMGKRDVAVLDGGLPKWRAEGYPVEDMPPEITQARFTADPDPSLVRDAGAITTGTAQIVDARAASRFRGETSEPRPGLRAGHIPGARNLPFAQVLNPDGTMKGDDDLRAAFAGAGVDLERSIVTSCGSGVTAAILSLALARVGHADWSLYDGSWAEWGAREDLPIATGDA
ncbi:3-mercaptopyruvate sulfurtransferase [Palleronia sp. LCG004]|uniref:3-mercaptopyruvate sulfurtransferase n=1 Tax=Palleronia sp. LCG004 TaxID=3079304 RepID=UPI0029422342|nr:3-mercaptopyruvate sulfurtransferase [Palleronia sp. LCG004]WOI56028.1 3-mercaptopyruvate sulfurtransferase [Palleronia sp. LCG004]